MSDTKILTEKVLSHTACTAVIAAPIEAIDLADWLLNLPDQEYQRCDPPSHRAAGYSTSDDGRPMSINVDLIGSGLVVQHYVARVAERDHCHLVSVSDVLTPVGWTTCQVIWCLKVEALDQWTCRYTNSVTSHPTEGFMAFIAANGQTFEEAASVEQAASDHHCRAETPMFAASIGRKANVRTTNVRRARHVQRAA